MQWQPLWSLICKHPVMRSVCRHRVVMSLFLHSTMVSFTSSSSRSSGIEKLTIDGLGLRASDSSRRLLQWCSDLMMLREKPSLPDWTLCPLHTLVSTSSLILPSFTTIDCSLEKKRFHDHRTCCAACRH